MPKKVKKESIEKTKSAWDFISSALFIPGFIFIGIAVGLLLNQVAVSVLIGIGLGFIFAAIAKIIKKN